MKKRKPSRSVLLSKATENAGHFVEYDMYGTETKAIRALKRRCPGFLDTTYSNVFRKALAMHNLAKKFVAQNKKLFWKNFNNNNTFCSRDLAKRFAKRQRYFTIAQIQSTN